MRDSAEAAAKEARAGFTKAADSAVEEAVLKVRSESELRRRRVAEEAVRVAEDDDRMRRAQEEEETSFSVRSSMADNLVAAAAKKAEGERLRAVEETIASVTTEKDIYMEEAAERAISERRRGLYKAVLESKAKFEAEEGKERKRVFEEAISILKERHDSELCEAVDRSIA